jgi:hypothetical protein
MSAAPTGSISGSEPAATFGESGLAVNNRVGAEGFG